MTTEAEFGRVPTWTLRDRLRKAREDAGLTQQQVADKLGTHRRSVVSWESGAIIPKRATVLAWAMTTGVPTWWLEGAESPRQGGPDGGGELLRLGSNQRPSD